MTTQIKCKLTAGEKEIIRRMRDGYIIYLNRASGKVYDNNRAVLSTSYNYADLERLHVLGLIKTEKTEQQFIDKYTLTAKGRDIKLDEK